MSERDDHLNMLFRAAVEKQYGAPMADEIFRRGNGKYAHEPYYTAMATRFRDFVAGYEAALSDGAERVHTGQLRDAPKASLGGALPNGGE